MMESIIERLKEIAPFVTHRTMDGLGNDVKGHQFAQDYDKIETGGSVINLFYVSTYDPSKARNKGDACIMLCVPDDLVNSLEVTDDMIAEGRERLEINALGLSLSQRDHVLPETWEAMKSERRKTMLDS